MRTVGSKTLSWNAIAKKTSEYGGWLSNGVGRELTTVFVYYPHDSYTRHQIILSDR